MSFSKSHDDNMAIVAQFGLLPQGAT